MLFEDVTVGDVLRYDETQGRTYAFISKRATIYDAEDLFRNAAERRPPILEAVLITENGHPDEALLGIITP